MKRIAMILAVVALVATACGAATEEFTEQLIEQSGGGDADVDVDLGSGQVSVETEDGSFTVGGGEIPDGFPVPFPDGGTVQSSFVADDGASVSVAYPLDRYDELVAYYGDWVAGQSGEWSTSSFENEGGDGVVLKGTSWWQGADVNLGVANCFSLLGDGGDGPDAACVTASVQG